MIGTAIHSSSFRNWLFTLCILILTIGLSGCLARDIPNDVMQ